MAIFPVSRGKIRISQGVENRGSLTRNEARKLFEKFGENSEQNSGRKFGELSFCNFSDLI